MYLVQVDDGLPEMGLLLVEVSHTNLSKVTGMVLSQRLANSLVSLSSISNRSNLVHVGTVVVLTTSQTSTTGMLSVLSDTSLTGGDVAAAMKRKMSVHDDLENQENYRSTTSSTTLNH